MRLLWLLKERHSDNTAFNHLLKKLFTEMGHDCREQDPTEFVTAHCKNSYIIDEEPFKLHTVGWIEDMEFDAVFYSNKPMLFDCTKMKIPCICVYDEVWKGIKIPPGTDYLICTTVADEILKWSSANEYKHLKGVFTGFHAVIPHDVWSPAEVKDIELAYMGIIRPERNQNLLLQNSIWNVKQEFIPYLKEKYGLFYPAPNEPIPYLKGKKALNTGGLAYEDYVALFPRVKICVHFSNEKSVGGGAWEALANGCILLEYPNSDAAKEAGLIHGENCFLFNTIDDIKKIFRWNVPLVCDETDKKLYWENDMIPIIKKGMELAAKYTYTSLASVVKWVEQQLEPKIERIEVPPAWTQDQIDAFRKKINMMDGQKLLILQEDEEKLNER